MNLFKLSAFGLLVAITFLSSPKCNAVITPVNVHGEILENNFTINVDMDNLHPIDNADVRGPENFIYGYELPDVINEHIQANGPLSAILLEDGVPLTKLHCWYQNIETLGMGRTIFCENGLLYFSTSNNAPITTQNFVIALATLNTENEEATEEVHEEEIEAEAIAEANEEKKEINNKKKNKKRNKKRRNKKR